MTQIKQQTTEPRVSDAPARDQLRLAADEHGWDATIDHLSMHEFCKGEQSLHVYYRRDSGAIAEVIFFRGEIGLAHLAPADSALDSALRWLAGLPA